MTIAAGCRVRVGIWAAFLAAEGFLMAFAAEYALFTDEQVLVVAGMRRMAFQATVAIAGRGEMAVGRVHLLFY